MPQKYYIRNATIVNEGRVFMASVMTVDGLISDICIDEKPGGEYLIENGYHLIDASGLLLFPGIIDDQVHFREPGLTHKDDMESATRCAVAGGVTTFMEMPNTIPPCTDVRLLEEKYARAAEVSLANYSFYLGATNSNVAELMACDPAVIPGVKVFLGASTGNLLVDNPDALEKIFSTGHLIAIHSENEDIIRNNIAAAVKIYGDAIPVQMHPVIRSSRACMASTSLAYERAVRHGTRLHVLHLSTEEELNLFTNEPATSDKQVTAEVCVHHLWFSEEDYTALGSLIKWNPAIKTARDREALWDALLDGRIDMVATDHAPHTLEEKQRPYNSCPSGGPLIQHALMAMLECHSRGKISLEMIAEKMCHAPARCFGIKNRGFIRKGFAADLVLVNPESAVTVGKDNILYKCGWSPFMGTTFRAGIHATFVNGTIVYQNGGFTGLKNSQRIYFSR